MSIVPLVVLAVLAVLGLLAALRLLAFAVGQIRTPLDEQRA